MTEPQIVLFVGDAYRCDCAVRARHAALVEADPACERHLAFADEVDASAMEIELKSTSLFALGRHFVVRQVERARRPKELVRLLDDAPAAGTYLTFVASELKASHPVRKGAKAIDAIVSLPAPRRNAARPAVVEMLSEAGLSMPGPAIQDFVLRCNGDLLAASNEVDKLRAYAAGDGGVDAAAVERLVFPNAEQTVYPLFDRIGEANLHGALAEMVTLRDDPGRTLSGAIRHLTRLTMIRVLLDRRTPRQAMAGALGMPAWLLGRLTPQAKARPLEDLLEALRTGLKLDRRIKQGKIPAADALGCFVLSATASMPRRRRGPG